MQQRAKDPYCGLHTTKTHPRSAVEKQCVSGLWLFSVWLHATNIHFIFTLYIQLTEVILLYCMHSYMHCNYTSLLKCGDTACLCISTLYQFTCAWLLFLFYPPQKTTIGLLSFTPVLKCLSAMICTLIYYVIVTDSALFCLIQSR